MFCVSSAGGDRVSCRGVFDAIDEGVAMGVGSEIKGVLDRSNDFEARRVDFIRLGNSKLGDGFPDFGGGHGVAGLSGSSTWKDGIADERRLCLSLDVLIE